MVHTTVQNDRTRWDHDGNELSTIIHSPSYNDNDPFEQVSTVIKEKADWESTFSKISDYDGGDLHDSRAAEREVRPPE